MASNQTFSLICDLCEQTYKHTDGPLMLSCLHSFCKPCLLKHIDKECSEDRKVKCPTCNVRSCIPEDGIAGFPINLHLSHIVETASYKKQLEGEVACQRCSEDTNKQASTFCCKCCLFLCQKCKRDHQIWLRKEDHDFIELEMSKKSNEDSNSSFKIHFPPQMCPIPGHGKEELKFFCKDCEILVCRDCMAIAHENHKRSYIDKVSDSEKEEFRGEVDGINDAMGMLEETIGKTKQMREQVQVHEKEAENRIDKMSKDLEQAVEDRRRVLRLRCEEIAQGKDSALSDQLNELQGLRDKIAFAKMHVVDAIDNHTPEELLSVKKAMKVQLDRIMEIYRRLPLQLKENEVINTSFDLDPLVEEIAKLGYFPSVPDVSFSCVEGLATPQAAVGKERKMVVVLRDEKNQPIEGEALFQYKVVKKGVDIDEFIPPKVTVTQSEKNDGTAIFGFIPEEPGEYEVTIMIRNEVLGRPYRILARQSRDYSNLPQPTIINLEDTTFGVMVNDKDVIYATNYSAHVIQVFNPDGTTNKIGGSDNAGGQLSNPMGITQIDDTIYVTSYGNHFVKMYSINGDFIGEFGGNGTEDGKFSNPRGICQNGKGGILVADFNNKRIQLFTSKGEHLKSITCTNYPWDVAVDTTGKIHVALYNNRHIAVFSPDGTPLGNETYNQGGNMQYPTGIFIDHEDNKFIAEGNNNSIRILGPTGALICQKTGLVGPYSCTVDKHGSIFVGEYSNKRVLKFEYKD